MPARSKRTPPQEVASWTRLTVPTSRTIEDPKSEDGRKWLMATTHVNETAAPGYESQCYGRVLESPETVWYITIWQSRAALTNFEASLGYQRQLTAHTRLSSTPPETLHFDVTGDFSIDLTPNIGIFDVFFPTNLSSDAKQRVDRVRGLVYHYAPGPSTPSAYVARPMRGWLHGTQVYEGQETSVMRFMHFWRSAESEANFKARAAIFVGGRGGMSGRGLTLYHHLLEQMFEAGALGVKEWHCGMKRLWEYWRERDEEEADIGVLEKSDRVGEGEDQGEEISLDVA